MDVLRRLTRSRASAPPGPAAPDPLAIYADPHAAHVAEPGDDDLRPPPDDLDAALRGAFSGAPARIDASPTAWVATDVVRVPEGARHVDLALVIDLPWEQTRHYEHSKLYWAIEEPFELSEDRVTCFPVRWMRRMQTVRVRLPDDARPGGPLRLRLDPMPGLTAGSAYVHSIRFVVGEEDSERTRVADLHALKERTLRASARDEVAHAVLLDHGPSSLSIELTPRCNLTCSHCSSHGEADLHRAHNRMGELDEAVLARLGRDAFPALTALGLVGRGEPLATTRARWQQLVGLLAEHRVLLTAVTNGTLITRRMTPELLPHIETLTVSVDGATPQTFAEHRGGTHMERVLDGIRHFHALRRASGLTRRPRLGISWTLMRDNVEELPLFLEQTVDLDVDLVYARHLLVFYERTRAQSLLGRPDLANPPLRRAYALLERHGIRSDCPPLLPEGAPRPEAPEVITVAAAAPRAVPPRDHCMFVHRTAVIHATGDVPTCSAPFALTAGRLDATTGLPEIWNGEVLQTVRRTLDTPDELEQCASCWYREGRYQAQRASADEHAERFDLRDAGSFTEEAWDFAANDLAPEAPAGS